VASQNTVFYLVLFIESGSELSRLIFVSKIPEMLNHFLSVSNKDKYIGTFGKSKTNNYLLNDFCQYLSAQILILNDSFEKHGKDIGMKQNL